MEQYGELFEPYRPPYHWWAVIEIGAALMGSMMSGLLLDNDQSCQSIQWANLALSAAVVSILLCRPYDTHLDFLLALTGGIAALVMSVALRWRQTKKRRTQCYSRRL